MRAKHASPIKRNEPWPQTRACFSFLTLGTTDRSASHSFLSCQEIARKESRPVSGTRRNDFSDTLCHAISVCLFCPRLFSPWPRTLAARPEKHRFTLNPARSSGNGSFVLLSPDGESERARHVDSWEEGTKLLVGFVSLYGISNGSSLNKLSV